MQQVVSIVELLHQLGFADPESRAAARAEMEAAQPPLTREGKLNIHASKVERVEALFWGREKLCAACIAALAGPNPVKVAPVDCEACMGGGQARRLIAAGAVALASGMNRVGLVGGSPSSDRQARAAFERAGLDVRILGSDSPVNARRAREVMSWADLILVRCPTEIAHSTTDLFRGCGKVVRVVTRGLDGVASALNQAAAERGGSRGA